MELGNSLIKLKVSPRDQNVGSVDECSFFGIISKDAKMQRLFNMMQIVAPKDNVVSIIGESGTGKELVARALHDLSPRSRKGKFISVNCSAIPRELIESELFGHEKGAFTGASDRRIGAFEEASCGTIFLDEIGDLDLSLQAKLLRVLQNNTIKRIGRNEEMPIDARIIVATNRDLVKEVQEGNFREDLFFRLHVIPIVIPPLRERKDDIPLLMDYFLKKHSSNGREHKFSPRAYRKTAAHQWPGNVRELENTVIRALTFCHQDLIGDHDLELISPSSLYPDNGGPNGFDLTWQDIEREELVRVLKEFNNNRTEAAKALGLPRTTLSSKLRKYSLVHKRF